MEEDRKLILIDPAKGIFLKEIDSTNRYVLENGVKGSFVVSETQTAGKGRGAKNWFSNEPNNLYFSALVQLDNSVSLPLLSLLCGKSVHKTCKEFFPSAKLSIKWPNDIYQEDKKVSGILLELQTYREAVLVVIGIGVNFYFSSIPKDIPNVGMLMQAPPTKELKERFIKKLIFELNLVLFNSYNQESIQQDLKYIYENSYLKNKKIQFNYDGKVLVGEFLGYSESGFLLLSSNNSIYTLQDTTLNFGVME